MANRCFPLSSNLLAVTGLALASACSAAPAPVEYGKVVITDVEPPERFSAQWPASTEAVSRWSQSPQALPQGHAIEGLLAGDESLFRRLASASTSVRASEHESWVRAHGRLMEFKPVRPEFCELARPFFSGPASTLRDVVATPFVRGCLKDGDRALVLRADTPAIAVVEYFAGFKVTETDQRPAWDPRFAEAVEAEYAAAPDTFSRNRVAWKLTAHPDPRAEAALIALYRRATSGEEKAELGLILRRAKGAEGRRLGASVCVEFSNSSACRNDKASRETTEDLRAKGFEVVSGDDELPPAPPPPPPDPPEKVAALVKQMVVVGLVSPDRVDLAAVKQADPLEILAAAGLVTGFDVETGMFPNEHDSLMRELAWLTRDAMRGAIFEEIPPTFDETSPDAVEQGPYRLSVYMGGKRYRIDAENHGDWYDLNSVLKLMNAVLADRKSPQRLFVLDGGGQAATVIAATPAAFAAAEKQGWLHAGDPSASERDGKAFESQVFDKMQ